METESNELNGCCAGNATLGSVTASIGVKINAAPKLRIDCSRQPIVMRVVGHMWIAAWQKPYQSCAIT